MNDDFETKVIFLGIFLSPITIFPLTISFINIFQANNLFGLIVFACISVAIHAAGCIFYYQIKSNWCIDQQKAKKYLIQACSMVLCVLLVIGYGVFACLPLSKSDVEGIIISELEPQISNLKNELNISDLKVEIVISSFEYESSSIFSNGSVTCSIEEINFKSKDFDDFSNEKNLEKFRNVNLDFSEIEIPRHHTTISEYLYCQTNLVNENGDKINASGIQNPTNSDSEESCHLCNGSGQVKYYYGASALEAALDGQPDYHYGQCGACQGKGYID